MCLSKLNSSQPKLAPAPHLDTANACCTQSPPLKTHYVRRLKADFITNPLFPCFLIFPTTSPCITLSSITHKTLHASPKPLLLRAASPTHARRFSPTALHTQAIPLPNNHTSSSHNRAYKCQIHPKDFPRIVNPFLSQPPTHTYHRLVLTAPLAPAAPNPSWAALPAPNLS